MAKRGVSVEDIRKTLSRPSQKYPIQKDKTQEFRRKVGKRVNYVVVEHKKNNRVIVVTVVWS